jgi:hypothetical protein
VPIFLFNNILSVSTLQLGVTIAFVSITFLPTARAQINSTAVALLCTNLPAQATLTGSIYQGILALLATNEVADAYFINTLAYLNSTTNQAALLAGGTNCLSFFSSLQTVVDGELATYSSACTTTGYDIYQVINAIIPVVWPSG